MSPVPIASEFLEALVPGESLGTEHKRPHNFALSLDNLSAALG